MEHSRKLNAFFHVLFTTWATVVLLLVSSCARPTAGQQEKNFIEIRCKEGPFQKNTPCRVSFSDGSVQNANIRVRGQSSRKYPRQSYRMKLSKPHSLCELPEHKTWILNANFIDRSFIRHHLSFELFRTSAPDRIAPHGCYEEVALNGHYKGLYFLSERIDRERCGVLPGYKAGGMVFKEPPVFMHAEQATSRPDEKYRQKFPGFPKRNVTKVMRKLELFIQNADSVSFNDSLTYWFDKDNLTDWALLLLFTNNTDGLLRNFYLYRVHHGAPFRVAVWDYDETFGRFGDGRRNDFEEVVDLRLNKLFDRMLDWTDFEARLATRWQELRNGPWHLDTVLNRVDEMAGEVEPFLERHERVWPMKGGWFADSLSFEQEIDLIRDFTIRNHARLDNIFAAGEEHSH